MSILLRVLLLILVTMTLVGVLVSSQFQSYADNNTERLVNLHMRAWVERIAPVFFSSEKLLFEADSVQSEHEETYMLFSQTLPQDALGRVRVLSLQDDVLWERSFHPIGETSIMRIPVHDEVSGAHIGTIELGIRDAYIYEDASNMVQMFLFLLLLSFFLILCALSLILYIVVIRPLERSIAEMEKLEKEL